MLNLISTTDVWPVTLAVLGILGALVAAVMLVFGQRARIVTGQQDLTISALEARLSAVESENNQLRRDNDVTKAIVGERDKRIAGLQSEVGTLRELFASAKAVEDLTAEVRSSHSEILAKLP